MTTTSEKELEQVVLKVVKQHFKNPTSSVQWVEL